MVTEVRPLGVKCNLSCSYCYQEPLREAAGRHPHFDVEAMKRTILANGAPFALFGGEPLLLPKTVLEELLAFGKGYEHGLLEPSETMGAIVLAMPLEDRERDGHLNRERNGDPVPGREVPESVWDELRETALEPAGA